MACSEGESEEGQEGQGEVDSEDEHEVQEIGSDPVSLEDDQAAGIGSDKGSEGKSEGGQQGSGEEESDEDGHEVEEMGSGGEQTGMEDQSGDEVNQEQGSEDEMHQEQGSEDEMHQEQGSEDEGRQVQGSEDDEEAGRAMFSMVDLQRIIQSQVHMTHGEIFLLTSALADRLQLTNVVQSKLLELVNALVGSACPSSSYKVSQIFATPSDKVTFFVYCKSCGRNIGKLHRKDKQGVTVLCDCGESRQLSLSGGYFFVMFNVKEQLRLILESKDVSTYLTTRLTDGAPEGVRGIENSLLYQKLLNERLMNPEHDFTVSFNADGAQMFNTTEFSLYPIQIALNELPPKLRHKYTTCIGFWYGKGPVMEVFMEPFVKAARDLCESGVEWELNGETKRSKFFLLCCCVDTVARPQLQNRTAFNGMYGCPWCYHPGSTPRGSTALKYPAEFHHLERTVPETFQHMHTALKNIQELKRFRKALRNDKISAYGVLGVSPLLLAPHLNSVWGFSPDYLHAVLEGVIKALTDLILKLKSVSKKINEICAILLSIRPPLVIHRLPQHLKDRTNTWKASDWKWWLLLYSLPCLRPYIPTANWNHLALLVEGVMLLLQPEVSAQEIEVADTLLRNFVSVME